MDDAADKSKNSAGRWLNATVLGIGLASLFSDWAHETATTLLPPFLTSLGVAAVWLANGIFWLGFPVTNGVISTAGMVGAPLMSVEVP